MTPAIAMEPPMMFEAPVRLDDVTIGELDAFFDDAQPEEILEWAFDRFGRRIAIFTTFQRETMVLLDMAHRMNPDVRVVTIDTGRLPEETHQMIERVREKYGIPIEVRYPRAEHVERMVGKHGPNLFYQSVDLRLLCCEIRKVLPLQNALQDLDCWVTGMRRQQWATRANVKKIELDHLHDGIVKLNPLADWPETDVLEYIRKHDVPQHELYAKGFPSIGCSPCTRQVPEGAEARSGRWWWETDAPKECGMHCSIETGGFEHELESLLGAGRSH
ncbi:MAG TPA: phosphoadenylyl-sulfate reductase [Armatimonadota bacterium]|nr:phosphoadenylyl-sulfate reductase [Armatimonadota bacterium]